MKNVEDINRLKGYLKDIEDEIDFHEKRLKRLQEKKAHLLDEIFEKDTTLISKISMRKTLKFFGITTDSDLIKFVDGQIPAKYDGMRAVGFREDGYKKAETREERLRCLSSVGEKRAKEIAKMIKDYENEKNI